MGRIHFPERTNPRDGYKSSTHEKHIFYGRLSAFQNENRRNAATHGAETNHWGSLL